MPLTNYTRSISIRAALPGVNGAEIALSVIYVKDNKYRIDVIFERGTVRFVRDIHVDVSHDGKQYSYSFNWRRVKGWLDHDCNLTQIGAERCRKTIESMFLTAAAEHMITLPPLT